jgi:hypothetical protein
LTLLAVRLVHRRRGPTRRRAVTAGSQTAPTQGTGIEEALTVEEHLNLLKVPEIRRKMLFRALLLVLSLAVYRVGAAVPRPIVTQAEGEGTARG